jgi:outer membrane biosynthesis protein TonB
VRRPVTIVAGFFIFFSFSSSLAQPELLQETPTATAAQATTEVGKPDVSKAGKDVSAPILIHSVEPKTPEVARKANLFGIVVVNCYIESDGTTSNVHANRVKLDKDKGQINDIVAKELEVNAVDAVKHYKFKPSKKDGKPVRVELNVDVHFGR